MAQTAIRDESKSAARWSSNCGKAAKNMSAATLKRKLRGFPVANLSVKLTGN